MESANEGGVAVRMAAAAAVAVNVVVKVVRSGLEGGMGRWDLDGGGV